MSKSGQPAFSVDVDHIQFSVPWKLSDYGMEGVLTEEQIRSIAD